MSTVRSFYFSRERLWIVYTLCLWNAICGGTLYMFPGMETDMMELWKTTYSSGEQVSPRLWKAPLGRYYAFA